MSGSRAKRSGNPAKNAWQPMVPYPLWETNPMLVEHHRAENPPGTVVEGWGNNIYGAMVCRQPSGVIHISFKRHDRAAIRDWRHMQQIKNEIAGPEREAVEIFPRESRLLDGANQFHLWVMPEGEDVPLGYWPGAPELMSHEATVAQNVGGGKGRQRPWQEGLTTGLGEG